MYEGFVIERQAFGPLDLRYLMWLGESADNLRRLRVDTGCDKHRDFRAEYSPDSRWADSSTCVTFITANAILRTVNSHGPAVLPTYSRDVAVLYETDTLCLSYLAARMQLPPSIPRRPVAWVAAPFVPMTSTRAPHGCQDDRNGWVAAQKLIKQGCEQCAKSEDRKPRGCIKRRPTRRSEREALKIWLSAANLEHHVKAKKRAYCARVSLASDARILLARAVEVIPQSVELWLALARLETPDKAKAVLNKARKVIPTSHDRRRAAARAGVLRGGQAGRAAREGARARRQDDQGGRARAPAAPSTAHAPAVAQGGGAVRERGRRSRWTSRRKTDLIPGPWTSDVEAAEAKSNIGAARAILAYALRVFPDKKSLRRKAADLEKARGTRESLNAILEGAVHHCPQAEVLWLMWANEKWLEGDVPAALELLERAFIANSESQQIWLAAVKLEAENGELGVARELLVRARTVADTQRVKPAIFERQQDQLSNVLETLATAIKKYPKFAKLYMIQGQIHHQQGNLAAARAAYAAGIKACPKDVNLIKARALLDKARLANSGNEVLWAKAVDAEDHSGGTTQAKTVLARVPYVWPAVVAGVARLFWTEREIEKARDWFGRAVAASCLRYQEQQGEVIAKAVAAELRYGLTWQPIAKDVANVAKSAREILATRPRHLSGQGFHDEFLPQRKFLVAVPGLQLCGVFPCWLHVYECHLGLPISTHSDRMQSEDSEDNIVCTVTIQMIDDDDLDPAMSWNEMAKERG
ncbi:TPR-like protein [Lentinus tigrinus ALCF2SS1-6]|uniref:TPR-like protein n=1 Tax=Lentinus tigrinus ALCF2SS1-6 TaxID=1328759 RepID=A0A5C2RVS9_9APHY|nr:TPR-like protein [Lentinus tigrinus ALCF2SS1-6]